MFRWYQRARICYVYLSDVGESCPALDDEHDSEEAYAPCFDEFRRSRWFRRGWTLQELLGTAPHDLHFYARGWTYIGSGHGLLGTVSKITTIDVDVLLHMIPLSEVSIAKRMSWAANRSTTRAEDKAYSLLGLFGINMPMLYGEGNRAFIRLQIEIIRTSTDHSIFAWMLAEKKNGCADRRFWDEWLFAPSPAFFARSGNVVRAEAAKDDSYTMTNAGLDITLPLLREGAYQTAHYLAVLDCRYEDQPNTFLALRLKDTPDQSNGRTRRLCVGVSDGERRMNRVAVVSKAAVSNAQRTAVLIPRGPKPFGDFLGLPQRLACKLQIGTDTELTIVDGWPRHSWNLRVGSMVVETAMPAIGAVLLRHPSGQAGVLAFAACENFANGRPLDQPEVFNLGFVDEVDVEEACIRLREQVEMASSWSDVTLLSQRYCRFGLHTVTSEIGQRLGRVQTIRIFTQRNDLRG